MSLEEVERSEDPVTFGARAAHLRRLTRQWNQRIAETWGSSRYAQERRRFYRLAADRDSARRREILMGYLNRRKVRN